MKKQAEDIVRGSSLSEASKALWLAIIEVNDESFAEYFMESIGDDPETLSIATALLHARTESNTPAEAGMITGKEQELIQTLQAEMNAN